MSDRRFTEEEAAAIFRKATESQQTPPREAPPGEGLTLAEIQEIGLQVGIDADAVARAAPPSDRSGPRRRPASSGFPSASGARSTLDAR
jgi:hypothetical protein